MMAQPIKKDPVSKRELLVYRAELKASIFRQIHRILTQLKASEFSQKDLARKLGVDEGALSRRLRGENDMQIETLCDLARGLDCRLEVELTPLARLKEAQSAHAVSFFDSEKSFKRAPAVDVRTNAIQKIDPPANEVNDPPLVFNNRQPFTTRTHQAGRDYARR
jgi:transcriptional regulator with XRE-family HTH domain